MIRSYSQSWDVPALCAIGWVVRPRKVSVKLPEHVAAQVQVSCWISGTPWNRVSTPNLPVAATHGGQWVIA